jgi:hypothetical protein
MHVLPQLKLLNLNLSLRGVAQLVKFYIYFLEITSLSLTNLRATGGLHNH